ncbi:MAG: metal ABC transporter solute-binding protein, Zn/Mn family [Rhodocyclaceae bacterium]
MLDVPGKLDRADGNPNIQTDPRNFLAIGAALATRMIQLDAGNAAAYRAGYAAFVQRLRGQVKRWEAQATPLKGIVVVSQHKAWAYLYDWLGLREVGTLEPKPARAAPSMCHGADRLTPSRQRRLSND